ncbi:response regulator [Patescibacteria group bacterium]|nr:response regulator [Patescibacteria group bacterium]
MKILLVEDDPLLIDIYVTKFKEKGFDVDTMNGGENVLETVKSKKPDVVILDIVLPHQDGWEILRQIKEDKDTKDTKIVVLSNLGQKEEVEKGLKLGAAQYLIKAHYTPSQVVQEIEKL